MVAAEQVTQAAEMAAEAGAEFCRVRPANPAFNFKLRGSGRANRSTSWLEKAGKVGKESKDCMEQEELMAGLASRSAK